MRASFICSDDAKYRYRRVLNDMMKGSAQEMLFQQQLQNQIYLSHVRYLLAKALVDKVFETF